MIKISHMSPRSVFIFFRVASSKSLLIKLASPPPKQLHCGFLTRKTELTTWQEARFYNCISPCGAKRKIDSSLDNHKHNDYICKNGRPRWSKCNFTISRWRRLIKQSRPALMPRRIFNLINMMTSIYGRTLLDDIL